MPACQPAHRHVDTGQICGRMCDLRGTDLARDRRHRRRPPMSSSLDRRRPRMSSSLDTCKCPTHPHLNCTPSCQSSPEQLQPSSTLLPSSTLPLRWSICMAPHESRRSTRRCAPPPAPGLSNRQRAHPIPQVTAVDADRRRMHDGASSHAWRFHLRAPSSHGGFILVVSVVAERLELDAKVTVGAAARRD